MNSIFLYLFSVFLSSTSQILLKSSANQKHEYLIKEYLNKKVIVAYFIFFLSSLLTVIAYKNIPLSLGPILEGTSYIYIALFSYLFLKERLSKKQYIGLLLILIGTYVANI